MAGTVGSQRCRVATWHEVLGEIIRSRCRYDRNPAGESLQHGDTETFAG